MASSVARSVVASVVAGLTPVSAVEVIGLLMEILTGESAEGFVLTTYQGIGLDRYLLMIMEFKATRSEFLPLQIEPFISSSWFSLVKVLILLPHLIPEGQEEVSRR